MHQIEKNLNENMSKALAHFQGKTGETTFSALTMSISSEQNVNERE